MLIIYIGEEYTIHMQTHSIALENFKYLNQTNIACMYLCTYVCVCVHSEGRHEKCKHKYLPTVTYKVIFNSISFRQHNEHSVDDAVYC